MQGIYAKIQKRALEIAARYPEPDFYRDFPEENTCSRNFFSTNPIILDLRDFVLENIEDDFGHGMHHATKVTLDAGALILIEGKLAGYPDDFLKRRLLLTQCAGLLHDLKRKQENHAQKSAEASRELLENYPVSPDEIEEIYAAIKNHEAFKPVATVGSSEGILLSGCLYDADKFRWGPDNFTHTVWYMVSYYKAPLSAFLKHYPEGISGVAKIKSTFRSRTGKKYGPQFIDIGLAIGKEIYEVIKNEFAVEEL
jgi:hypothetical protein